MPTRIIDTHIHIWDFSKARYEWLEGDTSVLNRTYAIGELSATRKEAGVSEGILVQAANNFEDTDWMLQMAEETDWLSGVVGWLPLEDTVATGNALAGKYGLHPLFKGVRHLIHNEADPAWLLQDAVLESLRLLADRNLPFDVVGIIPAHIETALKVAAKVPHLRMVFDHLNQPPIATAERFGRWGELMEEAAKHPNVFMKISGLGTASGNFTGWKTHDLKPYLEFVFQHFGAHRCFCGGDWPVSLLAGDYVTTWKAYQALLTDLLDTSEQDAVFYSNAAAFYKL